MENIQEQKTMQNMPKKERVPKWKIYLILFFLIIGVGIYGYFWYQRNNTLLTKAQSAMERAGQYDALKTMIIDERQRCESFIAQKTGDFGSFEYCQKFIQWTNKLNIND